MTSTAFVKIPHFHARHQQPEQVVKRPAHRGGASQCLLHPHAGRQQGTQHRQADQHIVTQCLGAFRCQCLHADIGTAQSQKDKAPWRDGRCHQQVQRRHRPGQQTTHQQKDREISNGRSIEFAWGVMGITGPPQQSDHIVHVLRLPGIKAAAGPPPATPPMWIAAGCAAGS